LNKLSASLIQLRIKDILEQEHIPFEEAAIVRLAKEGHGSMRDALTLLDQAIALGHGQVTVAALSAMMANFSSAPYLELLQALLSKDAGRLIALTADLDQKGVEFSTAAEELARLTRHGFILKTLGRSAPEITMMGLDDTELRTLTGIVELAAPLDLNRIFRTLAQCRSELDGAALDRYIFENYLLEWCLDPGFPDIESLLNAPAKPVSGSQPVVRVAPSERPSVPPQSVVPPASVSATPAAGSPSFPKRLPGTWRELVDGFKQLKPLQARKLEEVHPLTYGPDKIVLAVSDASYASKVLLQREEQVKVREQFKELYGFEGVLTIQPMAGATASASASASAVVAEAPPPETILTQRAREGEAKRQELHQSAESAQFTQDVVRTLGGKVEQVRVL
jgi:DNA polymerase III gamma/tau subunit